MVIKVCTIIMLFKNNIDISFSLNTARISILFDMRPKESLHRKLKEIIPTLISF